MTTPERLAVALADRYRIERELGQGGMATVYLAQASAVQDGKWQLSTEGGDAPFWGRGAQPVSARGAGGAACPPRRG